MNDLQLTKMTILDLDEIQPILNEKFDDFWSYDILKEELLSSSSVYFVCKNEAEIIGFGGIKTIIDFAELMNIVIRKDLRGNGFSKKLLEHIIKKCKELNLKSINLEVNVENTIAIKLYKKYNFVEVGTRKKYYNNLNDAILMTLTF